MKHIQLIWLVLLLPIVTHAQQILPVKDSIMNAYMESGFATEHFRPEGKSDVRELRQGAWKDYEVADEGFYQPENGAPLRTMGKYLLYGEGNFTDGKRTGDWKIYVIEDKSFRKILSAKLIYQEGIPNGHFEYYYPDGKIAQTGNYLNGKMEGESSILYPNGNVFGKQIFVQGNKEGKQLYFFPDGAPKLIIHYVKGMREGKYETFYKDGKTEESITYRADKIDGVYRYYYPSGKVWTENIYKNGALINITATYNKNGRKLDTGTLKDGNGYVNYYTEEGKIYTVITYKNGLKVKEESR